MELFLVFFIYIYLFIFLFPSGKGLVFSGILPLGPRLKPLGTNNFYGPHSMKTLMIHMIRLMGMSYTGSRFN